MRPFFATQVTIFPLLASFCNAFTVPLCGMNGLKAGDRARNRAIAELNGRRSYVSRFIKGKRRQKRTRMVAPVKLWITGTEGNPLALTFPPLQACDWGRDEHIYKSFE